jgi:hypothetical protein
VADRTPVFELHILPLFRQLDRQHMLSVTNKKLDLWSYDSVKAQADGIVTRACSSMPSMPTQDVGGAWPSEWRALFTRWIAGGFRRLSLGQGQNYKLVKSDTDFVLSCDVAIPNAPDGDSTAWFDIVDPGPAAATYRLWVFAGEAVPPATDTISFSAQENVDPAAAANGVTVIDASGTHRITVSAA